MNVVNTTVLVTALAAAEALAQTPPLIGLEAERFLREAEVVEIEPFESLGITEPRRVILSDGVRTARGLWKTHHEFAAVKIIPPRDRVTRFRDSFRHEIAAYRVSQLLDLGFVPATVGRTIGATEGSLQMWVEGATTEHERMQSGRRPPDPVAWNNLRTSLGVFLQLIADMDHRNLSNILVDDDFRIWKVDNSRAFRWRDTLREPEALNRFSRSMVERLRAVGENEWRRELARWLEEGRLDAFLARRAELLELVERRIAERGEDAVLFK
jgi:hypothetical protein